MEKRKHILSMLLLIATCLISTNAFAYDALINGIYYNFNGGKAEVTYGSTSYNSYAGDIVIPKSVVYNAKTYSVTSIGYHAFYNCKGLTSVTIGSSVSSIGEDAFNGCSGLKKVIVPDIAAWCGITFEGGDYYDYQSNPLYYARHLYSDETTEITNLVIPNSVTSIVGYYAFAHCSGLTSVTIPNSLTSIGQGAFSGCSSLEKVIVPDIAAWCRIEFIDGFSNPLNYARHLYSDETTEITNLVIPNSVTSIGDDAFRGCSGLTSVTIPNSVTSIGSSAFSRCSGLTSVTIPNSVTSIGYGAFRDGSGLTSVTIGNSVTSIGDDAFRGCSGLTSVTIGNSVRSISSSVFQDCSALTSVTLNSNALVGSRGYSWNYTLGDIFGQQVKTYILGDEVTSIGDYAFCDGSALTSVTIGNSVTSIGGYAFSGCSGLTSVTIPNSVTSMGSGAFSGCFGLEKVIVPDIGAWCGIAFGDYNTNPLYYARHLYSDETTEITNLIIPNSVTSIGMYAFSGCSGLTSVTIPNSVTSIGQQAFDGCSSLTSITIPNSVTSIGISAFNGCSGLTSVTIGNSVTSIGGGAFLGCSGLTSVTIPNSVTSIGLRAFEGCSGLTSVTIPNSVKSIESSAFSGCSGLTSVTLNSNAIASKKYTNSSSLRGVFGQQVNTYFIGEDVTCIGDYAFHGCSGLTSVNIPNSVTSIGSSAFSGCSSLTSVTLNNNALVSKSYSWDSSLENVFGQQVKTYILGGDVTSIGESAFHGCSGLTSVTIPNSVTSIGSDAFEGCSGLTSVTIPNSVTRIGLTAFSGCSSLEKVIVPDIAAWCRIEFSSFLSNPLNRAHHLYSDETTEITNLIIPNSVTSIRRYAFAGCSGLTSVTIGNSVTSIGGGAFEDCSALTSVTIPNSVTNIGSSAFDGCSGLTSVTIPNSVTSIGGSAFYDCSGLTSVTIGNSVTSIGDYAFTYCSSLTSINIPNSVTSIGDDAFSACFSLEKVIVPDIAAWCVISFGDDSSNPLCYGGHLYSDETTEITNLIIPNSVTSIGRYAFNRCSGLTSVTIGNSVKEIGYYAFAECAELTDVYCYAENVPSTDSDAFYWSSTGNATLHVPAASIEQYKATEPWSNFGAIVPLTDEDAIAEVQAVPVLIQTQGNTIIVEGAEAGTEIILYGANGVQLDSVVATTGVASLNASRLSGSVAIVKIGNKTVKVLVKQ